MSLTNYPNGVSSFGIPVVGAGPVVPSGNVWFVSSVTGGLGDGTSKDFPLATLTAALAKAVSGDVIFLLSGHAETIVAAGGITCSTAGITVIGLGSGAVRPTFTFGTATTASFLISGASFTMKNVVGVAALDGLTKAFNITGANCTLDIEWQDGSSLVEAETAVLTAATADNLNLKLKYTGFPAGNAAVAAVKLVGCNDARIDVDLYGIFSTAGVNFVTTACTDVTVTGYMYNSGTTNGSKLVVDTVTGSTWYANIYDGAAGLQFAGGSGAALASASGAPASTFTVPTADATTNTNERDVIGNKTDAGVVAVGTTKSIVAYVKGLITNTIASVADTTNNIAVNDIVGNKTDASVYVPGTTKSLAAYAKGASDLQERVAFKAAATMVNGQIMFTVAGGPIQILGLLSLCVTDNNSTASTLQYAATATVGATLTTISGASASLGSAVAGATVALAGTALTTAARLGDVGPNLMANPGTVIVTAGTISMVIGTGSTTGTWSHWLRYAPLGAGVTVS